MMTIELLMAQEMVAGIVRERLQEAQEYALEREACRRPAGHQSRMRLLVERLRWRSRRRAGAQPSPSAA